jgi:cytochrome c-type biogenesis protein
VIATGATVLAGIGPDKAWAYYLSLGMVATVNPCGFAMLPAYLSYFLGLEDSEAEVPRASVAQAVQVACAVAAGFLAVFALAGAAVELTSLPVYENVPWISIVIGLGLLALGLAMLFGFEPNVRLPRLDRGGRERTVGSMFVFGVSYAIASIGCTLPLFLGAVAGTMTNDSVVGGVLVFAVYGLGMTVVLLALTVGMALARTSIVRFLRRVQPYVGRVAGGLVALAGAYVAYYGWLEVRLGRTGQVPDSNITDVVSGWSTDVTEWIRQTGSVRIGVVVAVLLAGVVVAVRSARSSEGGGTGGSDGSAPSDHRRPAPAVSPHPRS